ncbi:MAG TPA: LytTR family DNA-binding domain-containing protein [Thermoanaerobaculia bacterium]|nr:LytTR family DNA-binding domain-containing protein [Thermoanaerobaculia bacterium]
MSLKAMIVEDEPLARERLHALLAESDVTVVGEAENAFAAALQIGRVQPDLLFVDIEIPGESGIEFVRGLGPERRPVVIFTTAHPEYALEAFDVSAADYLVKPFDRERVVRALDRARRLIAGGRVPHQHRTARIRERFAVRTRGEVVVIKTVNIDWIAAEGNYSRIHAGQSAYLVRETLQSVESSLDPAAFIRVHRSAIVNLDRVHKLSTTPDGTLSIVLSTGAAVPLGRSYRPRLEEIFGEKL